MAFGRSPDLAKQSVVVYFFYAQSSHTSSPVDLAPLDSHYTSVLWQPAMGGLVPSGISKVPFAAWWLLHSLHVFLIRYFAMFVIYDGDRVIHRSLVFPGYFRFPFMAKNDLQIGDTWTLPEYRGQGLASLAVGAIVGACRRPGRAFWYVVDQNNLASIRAIEKSGFVKIGEGIRTKRFGLRALGAFVIVQRQSTLQN